MNEIRRKHRDLRVWQAAIEFSAAVYRFTEVFPKSEQFGLTSQLRRAAVSIAANLAEGAGRRTTRELLHFVAIARGSAAEVDTLLEIARRTGIASNAEEMQALLDHLLILILRFESALKKKTPA